MCLAHDPVARPDTVFLLKSLTELLQRCEDEPEAEQGGRLITAKNREDARIKSPLVA